MKGLNVEYNTKRKMSIVIVVTSINEYFAATYKRTGGGHEVSGALWGRSL